MLAGGHVLGELKAFGGFKQPTVSKWVDSYSTNIHAKSTCWVWSGIVMMHYTVQALASLETSSTVVYNSSVDVLVYLVVVRANDAYTCR